MRKFTKVLAAVLTLCLLCGAIAISIFADGTQTATTKTVLGATDFESYSVKTDFYTAVKHFNGSANLQQGGTSLQGAVAEQKVGSTTNKYLSISRVPTIGEDGSITYKNPGSSPYFEYGTGANSATGVSAAVHNGFSYFISEFDIGCNEYYYELDGVAQSGTTYPAEAKNVRLNYPSNFTFRLLIRGTGATYPTYSLYRSGSKWYISKGNAKVELSSIAGAYNHVSCVVKVDLTNPGNSKEYVFVNGEYLVADSVVGSTATELWSDTFRFIIGSASFTNTALNFNVSLDNIATYAYKAADNATPDLDAYETGRFDNSNELAFNKNTDIPTNPYVMVDGVKRVTNNYFTELLATVADGSAVEVSQEKVTKFTPADSVNSFTVTLTNGAQFDLSVAADKLFKRSVNGNVITFTRLANGFTSQGFADFEENTLNDSFNTNDGSLPHGTEAVVGNTIYDASIKRQIVDGVINKFYSVTRKTNTDGSWVTGAKGFYAGFCNGDYMGNKTMVLANYAYHVTEFDIMCNQYKYTLDGVEYMSATVPEGAENVYLAYPENLTFYNVIRGAGVKTYSLNYIDSEWQFGAGTDRKSVSDEAGVWNHIAFVVKVDKTAKTAVQYLYLNGELVFEFNLGSVASAIPDQMRFTVQTSVAGKSTGFNYCLDNMNSYTYGESPSAELDAFFTSGSYKTSNLAYCSDLYFDLGYAPLCNPCVSVEDGNTYFFETLYDDATAALSDGKTLTVYRADFPAFTPASGITAFDVILKGGATLTLSDGAAAIYKRVDSDGAIAFSTASEDEKVTVNWMHGNGRDTAASQTVALGNTPNVGFVSANAVNGVVDFENGSISVFNGEWTYADGSAVSPITAEMTAAGTVNMKSGLKDSGEKAKFGLTDKNGVFYVPAGQTFANFKDLTKMWTMAKTAEPGSTFKFFDTDGDGKVKVEGTNFVNVDTESFDVNINLNGLTVIHYTTGSYTGYWFNIKAENATIDIYNGTIYHALDNSANSTTDKLYGSSGIVDIQSNVKAAKITFGTADGSKPINFYGGSVIYARGSNTAVSTPDTIIDINVYGGTYYCAARAAMSLFAVSHEDVDIYVEGATLIHATGNGSYGLFADYYEDPVKNQNIYCKDSILIGTNPTQSADSTIFGSNITSLKAEFENCLISGKLRTTKTGSTGSIILGAGNRVAGTMASEFTSNSTIYNFGENIASAANTNGYFNETVTVTYPKNFTRTFAQGYDLSDINDPIYELYDITFVIPVSYVTYLESDTAVDDVVDSTDIVDVVFAYGDEVYDSVKWYAGAKVTAFPNISGKTLTNGWYNLAFSNWHQESDGTLTVKASGNRIVPDATPVAAITGSKLSMSLWNDHSLNLYVPVSSASEISNVTFYKFDSDRNPSPVADIETVMLDGIQYYLDSTKVGVTVFGQTLKCVEFTVDFDIDGDGENESTTIKQYFAYGVLDYANKVIDSYSCGSDEAKLVYALIDYKDKGAKRVNAPLTAAQTEVLNSFYAKFDTHENCDCKADLADLPFSDEEKGIDATDRQNLSGLIGATFGLTEEFTFQVHAINGNGITDVKVEIVDPFTGETVSYGIKAEPVASTMEGQETTLYVFSGMKGYQINCVVTITVVTESGEISGQYCLAEYIDTYGSEDAAKAFWAYSKAAYDYKIVRAGE